MVIETPGSLREGSDNVMAALERAEIETAACTSSVRVSTAFARESSYHDAIDCSGDCSARNRSVCESSYHGSGMLVQSKRLQRRPLTP